MMSSRSTGHGGSYLGLSSLECDCGLLASRWRAGTVNNFGRVFLRCSNGKVRSRFSMFKSQNFVDLHFFMIIAGLRILALGGRVDKNYNYYTCWSHQP